MKNDDASNALIAITSICWFAFPPYAWIRYATDSDGWAFGITAVFMFIAFFLYEPITILIEDNKLISIIFVLAYIAFEISAVIISAQLSNQIVFYFGMSANLLMLAIWFHSR